MGKWKETLLEIILFKFTGSFCVGILASSLIINDSNILGIFLSIFTIALFANSVASFNRWNKDRNRTSTYYKYNGRKEVE